MVERTPQEIRLHILKLEIRTDKNNIIGALHMELLTVLLMAKVPGVKMTKTKSVHGHFVLTITFTNLTLWDI